jgi:hypothetical protein
LLAVGVFVSITQGRDALSPEEYRRCRDVLLKRLRRAYPDVWGVWKVEPQGRGAAHDHWLVLVPADQVDEFRRWLTAAVLDVFGAQGSSMGARRRRAVDVQAVTSAGIAGYLSAELGKSKHGQGSWSYRGRRWGVINGKDAARYLVPFVRVDDGAADGMRQRAFVLEDRCGWRPIHVGYSGDAWSVQGVLDGSGVSAVSWDAKGCPLVPGTYRDAHSGAVVTVERWPRDSWDDPDAVAWLVDGDLGALERFVAKRARGGPRPTKGHKPRPGASGS